MDNARLAIIVKGVRSICDEFLTALNPGTTTAAGVPAAPPATGGVPPAPIPNTAGVQDSTAGAPLTGPAPVELDAEGLPWDERIHTAKKSQLKSGVWRLKPGVDALLMAQVKSELTLAAQAANKASDFTPAEDPTETPLAGDQAPGPDTAGDPAGYTAPASWSELIDRIVTKGATPDAVLTACTACGIDNIGALQNSPDLIPNVAAVLGV